MTTNTWQLRSHDNKHLAALLPWQQASFPWQQTPGRQLCSQAYPSFHSSVCVDNNKRKQKSSAKWEGLGIFITWWMHGAGEVASSGGPVELHHPLDYSRLETLENINIPLDQSWTLLSLCQMNVFIFPALQFPCINAYQRKKMG